MIRPLIGLLEKILDMFTVKAVNPHLSATTGTTVSYRFRRCGNVVTLWITFRNTSGAPAGSTIYEATMGNLSLPPAMVTGATYYGAACLAGSLTSGGTVTIRNTYSNNVTIPSNQSATISFTYITERAS